MNAPLPRRTMRISPETYLKLQQRSATLYARELERWNDRRARR